MLDIDFFQLHAFCLSLSLEAAPPAPNTNNPNINEGSGTVLELVLRLTALIAKGTFAPCSWVFNTNFFDVTTAIKHTNEDHTTTSLPIADTR